MMLILGLTAMAQSNGIDRYYETYKQDDRFTRISVSGKMFGLFANFEMDDPTEQEAVQTISKIKGLKMLVGDAIPEAKSIYVQAVKRPNAPKFLHLTSASDVSLMVLETRSPLSG